MHFKLRKSHWKLINDIYSYKDISRFEKWLFSLSLTNTTYTSKKLNLISILVNSSPSASSWIQVSLSFLLLSPRYFYYYSFVILELWFLMKVYWSITLLPLIRISVMITRITKANPSKEGTKAIIHVGLSRQLDSTSQKGTPANFLQQLFRQSDFSWSVHS